MSPAEEVLLSITVRVSSLFLSLRGILLALANSSSINKDVAPESTIAVALTPEIIAGRVKGSLFSRFRRWAAGFRSGFGS